MIPFSSRASFVESGARWLHVVDLDGARAGEPVQQDAIAAIQAEVGDRAQVEAGGGLRTADSVAQAISLVASHGSSSAQPRSPTPAFLAAIVEAHGAARVVVAIDVRDGLAIGDGWRTGTPGLPPDELIDRLADAGVTTFEVTAVERDGLLGGPDLRLLERLVGLGRGSIIASGGIRSAADLAAVRELGCVGAIVGRALYDGSLTRRGGPPSVEPIVDLGPIACRASRWFSEPMEYRGTRLPRDESWRRRSRSTLAVCAPSQAASWTTATPSGRSTTVTSRS